MAQPPLLLVRVVSSSWGDISESYTNVPNLLEKLSESGLGAMSLVQGKGNHIFIVSMVPIEERSLPQFHDGVREATKYLTANSPRPCLVFQFNTRTEPTTSAQSETSHLLVISRYDKPNSTSSTLSCNDDMGDVDTINEKLQEDRFSLWIPSQFKPKYSRIPGHHSRRRFQLHFATWVLISLFALAIIIAVSYTLKLIHYPTEMQWIRYPTPRSEGPRHQLEFNHHNVSSWVAANPIAKDEYYIRLDDGCMFAPNLVDEQELRYQRLLEARYPELNDLRMQRKYLNEEFLGDPFAIQIKVDNAFHLGHCVLAIRRYWWARETGRHVCPKDIDFRHIRHCLDVFDSWVFPEDFPQHRHHQGSMARSVANETGLEDSSGWDMSKPAWFVWKQEVCF